LAQAPQRPIPQPNSFSALGPTSLSPRPSSPRPNPLPHAQPSQGLAPAERPPPSRCAPGPACHPSPSAYLAAQQSPAAIPAALPSLLPRRDLRPLPFKHPAGPCAPSHPPAPPQNPSSGCRYPELGAGPPAAAGEFFLSRILAAGLISGHADPLARFAVPPIVDPCGPGAGDAQQQPSFELRPRASAQTSPPVPCAANPSAPRPR